MDGCIECILHCFVVPYTIQLLNTVYFYSKRVNLLSDVTKMIMIPVLNIFVNYLDFVSKIVLRGAMKKVIPCYKDSCKHGG